MRLNQSVCKVCRRRFEVEHDPDWGWNAVRGHLGKRGDIVPASEDRKSDDDLWEEGRVVCPLHWNPDNMAHPYDYPIDGPPPARCKYRLEHIVEWNVRQEAGKADG